MAPGWYWEQWNVQGTAGSTQIIDLWSAWTQTTATTTHTAWNQWVAQPVVVVQQDEERRQREEERWRAYQATKEKARQLLARVLDSEQQQELEKDGHFHVTTRDGERVYRLRPGSPPVRIKSEDGSRWSYCIHPRESFPAEDTAAALKLLIETDEEEFLRIANATRIGTLAPA